MIYASLNAKKGNYQYPAAIATALEFLAKPETAELPVGRYELDFCTYSGPDNSSS